MPLPTAESKPKQDTIKNHFFFVIHGMGQEKMRFLNHMNTLTDLAERLKSNSQDRHHFIPIEWHLKLHELPTVDKRMASITLQTVPFVRRIQNERLADAFYYMTEYHGDIIRKIVTHEINAAYAKIMEDHSAGTIGGFYFIGHSLGSTICYDILTRKSRGRRSHPLNVTPISLFSMGSPLGAIMVMRGQDPLKFQLPSEVKHYNIYDSYDPIAYRLEPLLYGINAPPLAVTIPKITTAYLPAKVAIPSLRSIVNLLGYPAQQESGSPTSVKPVRFDNAASRKRKRSVSDVDDNVDAAGPEEKMVKTEAPPTSATSEDSRLSVFGIFTAVKSFSLYQIAFGETPADIYNEVPLFEAPLTPRETPLTPESESVANPHQVTRIDYQLPAESIMSLNEYLSGARAHFSYWGNEELVSFIIN
eukprot:Partr_v1_DN27850_c0_g1_i4_m23125 putative DDHD domain containing